MTSDSELLRRFAQARSEDAFGELVKRHVDLVYSAALRQVNGDRHLAEDVAQTVFADLARKAGALTRRESLTGWLYTSAHFAAAKVVRGENRRRHREEQFMLDPASEPTPEADWQKLRPALDEAMHELKASDREAILLRYFENRQFAEVGARLGLNENAARMRVERAVEKLRGQLARRGVTTATALASVLSTHAVQTAPAGLAAAVTATSVVSVGTGTFTLLNLMTATHLKLGIGALAVAGAATVLVLQHQAREQALADNAALTQQLAELTADRDSLSNRLQAGAMDTGKLPAEQFNELLKLRGEVGVLRRQKAELQGSLAKVQAASARTPGSSPPASLPMEYPRTADGATTNIFALWSRGDWEGFITNFGQPGVPKEFYDKMFNDQMKTYLAGMQVLSVGEPTNGLSANHYFVPYKVQFQDGSQKEFRLSVKQDPGTQRWYFDGGF